MVNILLKYIICKYELVKNKFRLATKFYRKGKKKEVKKRKSGFVDIYGQDKVLVENKGRSCGKDNVINAYTQLGVAMSQKISTKKSRLKKKCIQG